MEFLADTWVLWIILTVICLGLVYLNRQNRRFETGFITSAEEFSIKTVLFGLKRGEGDLFIGYIFAIIFFSLFLMGIVRWLTTIF
jgi:hypothetical protein